MKKTDQANDHLVDIVMFFFLILLIGVPLYFLSRYIDIEGLLYYP